MANNINQLLAKAMSTTSEEEAMSCLRMARKKGKSFDDGASSSTSSSLYNGQNAKYWYDKANHYYQEAKKRDGDLTREQQQHLWRMYRDAYRDAEKMAVDARMNNNKLLQQIERLKHKQPVGLIVAVLVQALIIVVLATSIG